MITKPHFSEDISFKWSALNDENKVVKRDGSKSVYAMNAEVARDILFSTPVIERTTLQKVAGIKLSTLSKDQGWCGDPSQGSWSWFEIGILGPEEVKPDEGVKPDEEVKEGPEETQHAAEGEDSEEEEEALSFDRWHAFSPLAPAPKPKLTEDGKELRWKSHNNTLSGQQFEWHQGEYFGPEHEIWSHLEPGKDRLAVWMCAQFGAWSCQAQKAVIHVREWFEPTLL